MLEHTVVGRSSRLVEEENLVPLEQRASHAQQLPLTGRVVAPLQTLAPSAGRSARRSEETHSFSDISVQVPEDRAVRSSLLVLRSLSLADEVNAAQGVKDLGVLCGENVSDPLTSFARDGKPRTVLLKHVECRP